MNGVSLDGFTITSSTQSTILIIFLIYSIVIIGLGLYVKYSSKKSDESKLANFITGGGDLNAYEVAMIATTTAMAGGTMVGGPGLTYRIGLIYTLAIYTAFISTFVTLGTFGKKFAIVRQRTKAQTISQLIYHRFQSTSLVVVLVGCGGLFSIVSGAGQLVSAAKLFAAIMGGRYMLGLFISIIAVAIYSISGGVKSLAKVAVLQGALMLAAVLFIGFAQYNDIFKEYGSIQAGMEMLQRANGALLQATSWKPLFAIGIAVVTGWGATGIPAAMQSTMFYKSPKVLTKATILGCGVFLIIRSVMGLSGVLTAIINPNLQSADWSTIYIASNFLPPWMAGVVVAGIFAAIQSSIAGFLIMTGGSIAIDIYKTCINKEAGEDKVQQVNLGILLVGIAIMIIIALRPGELVEILILFASGCMAASYMIPFMLGAYWRKATAAGTLCAAVSGPVIYIAVHLLSSTKWYSHTLGNMHPILPAIILPLFLGVVVSLCTQDKKVPLGIYKVWFCKDYDEEFALMYDANAKARRAQAKN